MAEIGEGTGKEKIRGVKRQRNLQVVPFALRLGNYDLAGIRLTALVLNIVIYLNASVIYIIKQTPCMYTSFI